jgi:hypothetical protein
VGRLCRSVHEPHLGEGVARLKCGTCRYFEEAGLAGSGWCHHPERKTSNDLLIMVRRNELACRDEWEHSLWESAAAAPSGPGEPTFGRPPSLGPLPPTTANNLHALLNRAAGSGDASEGEDVLLSEARIVSEPMAPREAPVRHHPSGGFDPRSAIFRARETYRERARAKIAAARQSSSIEAQIETRSEAAQDARNETPEPVTVGGLTDDALPDDGDSRDTARDAVAADDWRTGRGAAARGAGTSDGALSPVLTAAESQWSEEFEASASQPLEPEPEPGWLALEPDEALVCAVEPDAMEEVAVERTLALPAPLPLHELPPWFRTDLPRECRTCRDYRPAADGHRGWCANAWAFTHSRLVQADEVTPCLSAIGDWWVAVDDVWLVAADVSAHGRATPLLDQLVAQDLQRRRRS